MPKRWITFFCDLRSYCSSKSIARKFKKRKIRWNIWINAVGDLNPIGPFFKKDFLRWQESLNSNAIQPLRLLHSLWHFRNPNGKKYIVFFAGAGTNGPADNYSAYCTSKIILVKMVELLDSENPNACFFIIGPGIVKTKIHYQTMLARASAGKNYKRVKKIFDNKIKCVSHKDVFECLKWCISSGQKVIGGRNLSLVSDKWKNGGVKLISTLTKNSNLFKLRRFSTP